MDSNLAMLQQHDVVDVVLPADVIARCEDFGRRCAGGYVGGRKDASLYYATHGIEANPIALAEAKMAECAFAIWLGYPLYTVNWGDDPDIDWDFNFRGVLVDVKQTKLTSAYRRLMWPANKVSLLNKKNFHALTLVKTAPPRCRIAGWISKDKFIAQHKIATAADRIQIGNWFVTDDELWPVADFKHANPVAQLANRAGLHFEFISGQWPQTI